MRLLRRQFLHLTAGAAALPAVSQFATAQAWPARPVTVIVPFAAGGNTDTMARLGAQQLTNKFGRSFIVENRPSAGGALGTGQVSRSAPDGYTLLFTASTTVVLTPQLQKLDFDPEKQLVPITNVGTATEMIAIRKDLPAKTLPEFLAYAKSNPGKLNYVTAGTQNLTQLAPAMLLARAGVDMVMIPAKSGPQAVSDITAGRVDLYFGNSSELLPHVNSGTIRLIAVGTTERIAAAPDIPTVSEALPGFDFSSWNGFLAPAGTPEPIMMAIRREITALVRSPEISGRLAQLGIIPGGLTKEQCEAIFRKDHESFAAAIKAAGIPSPK
jgi:tripartite-type tricarboxylate transporter receptor subunit TctC